MRMELFKMFLVFLVLETLAISHPQKTNNGEEQKLRIMSWNVWRSGSEVDYGLQKIVKHILLVNPDIAALQEIHYKTAEKVKSHLGAEWHVLNHTDLGTAIFTRHNFVSNSKIEKGFGIGATISLKSGNVINVWSAHLLWANYGPDLAHNKSIKDIKEIMAAEQESRLPSVKALIESSEFQKWLSQSKEVPIVFCGDFNTPSHLDWIEENKKEHGNWVIEWPTTKLMETNGFIDSYRYIHPNVTQYPALSWSTVEKVRADSTPEPQDRIDFILYKGPLAPIESTMYSGNETLQPTPNHRGNDFPSDHAAFVTDFTFV